MARMAPISWILSIVAMTIELLMITTATKKMMKMAMYKTTRMVTMYWPTMPDALLQSTTCRWRPAAFRAASTASRLAARLEASSRITAALSATPRSSSARV